MKDKKKRTRAEVSAAALEKRKAGFGNFQKYYHPDVRWDFDPEYYAAYGRGPLKKHPVTVKGKPLAPTDPNFRYNIDEVDALQLYLNRYPFSGPRHRMLGRIVDGVLETHRAGKESLHWHPRLNCYTIALFPIANAKLFGIERGVRINDGRLITIEHLLKMPEVPPKERGGYERQIQILGVAKEEFE